jgi:hypothetical protein
MEAVAHNRGFAKKVGIPQKVGKHFHEADMKGKKRFFPGGGVDTNETDNDREMKASYESAKIAHRTPPKSDPNNPTGHKGMVPYKKGGKVVKESKEMAQAEMKALKRGHAPKNVIKHEEAEHKAMGYKKGGHVKHAPKHHEKHMKRGGVSARMKKPAVPPAALAAMLGGAGGADGAPPMGAPGANGPPGPMGMAHGGHVHHHHAKVSHHHHHHHYAHGGHVKHHAKGGMTAMKGKEFDKDSKGVEPIIGGKSHKGHHGDEAAKKGHTKAKVVKMARGGHVGSHKHRKSDGIAKKGHTSCKMR